MNALASILVTPMTGGEFATVMGAFFAGLCAVIYAWKSIPRQAPPGPDEAMLSEAVKTVNRHGEALNNLNDAMAKVSLATTPRQPFVAVAPPAPVKSPEVKP